MFLQIPDYRILDFDILKFAEYVLDAAPCETRSQERPLLNAVSAIAAAKNGVAEMVDADAVAFQAACDAVPYPPLKLTQTDPEGKPLGEPVTVPRTSLRPFYEAVENMTAERPETEKAPEPEAQPATDSSGLPAAAE